MFRRFFLSRVGRSLATTLLLLAASLATGEETTPLPYEVQTDVVHRQLDSGFCWFHPRAAAIPGHGKHGQPAVMMTIQKHLAADDHYSGMWYLRSDDLGKTWTGPTEIAELAWQPESPEVTISVADVTPAWHAASGKLLVIGTKVRYSQKGAQLDERPKSNECAYATFDPATNRWSSWKMLTMPDTANKFFLVCPGCVQWVTKADGTLLLPVYYRGPSGADYASTVLHCRFDGQTLEYIQHGDELVKAGGRGFVEPSLIEFGGKYYLTLRNDARGYVTTSEDGQRFGPVQPWTFDDGKELGSYNTQAHWLAHSDGLFLSYTRRGADNDHIARNRAPLFLAQVDSHKLQVLRHTEQVLIRERGVMLGNFGASPITAEESWVTDSEFLVSDKAHARGGDGSTFAARVKWSRANRLVQP